MKTILFAAAWLLLPSLWVVAQEPTQAQPRTGSAKTDPTTPTDAELVANFSFQNGIEKDEEGNVISVNIFYSKSGRLSDKKFKVIMQLKHLRVLKLSGTEISDQQLRKIVETFPKLKELDLDRNSLSIEGALPISQLKELESLSLSSWTTSDASLQLPPKLKSLALAGSSVTEACIESLAKLKHLQRLSLPRNCCTQAIVKLEPLKQLESLTFASQVDSKLTGTGNLAHALELLVDKQGTSVDQAIKILGLAVNQDGEGHVTQVNIWDNYEMPHADDRTIKYLGRLQHLEHLYIESEAVSDQAFSQIKFPQSLIGLMLGSNFTRAILPDVGKIKTLRALQVPLGTDNESLAHLRQLTSLESLDLKQCPIGRKGIAHLAGMKNLKSLDLSNTRCQNLAVEMLVMFPKLERLNLSGNKIKDGAMKTLGDLTELKELNLENTQISDAGILQLGSLKKLDTLITFNTSVTSKGRIALFNRLGCKPRKILELEGASIEEFPEGLSVTLNKNKQRDFSDKHCELLAQLSNVQQIRLHRVGATGKGLEAISSMPNIGVLHLYHCPAIDDAGLIAISKMKTLKNLAVTNCVQVTDKGVEALAALRNVKSLFIRGTVKEKTIEKLKEALPDCKIRFRFMPAAIPVETRRGPS